MWRLSTNNRLPSKHISTNSLDRKQFSLQLRKTGLKQSNAPRAFKNTCDKSCQMTHS